jgi:hypothetical protein
VATSDAQERDGPRAASDLITADHVNAIIVPASAFGGGAVMSFAARPDVLVIAVDANSTAVRVPPTAVGISESRILRAKSYAEAAGFIAAHKAGIDITALSASVPPIRPLEQISFDVI